jgi:hypothetical protein
MTISEKGDNGTEMPHETGTAAELHSFSRYLALADLSMR